MNRKTVDLKRSSTDTEPTDFDTLDFERKLSQLKDSQDSINQLSAWCLQNRKFHKTIVASWLNVIRKVRIEQRLVLFYLANDVIQFSKRKGYEFVESWSTSLQRATTFVRDEKVKPKILRIFNIWETRCIYAEEFVTDLTSLLQATPNRKKDDQDSSDFQSSYLISKINNCVQLEKDTGSKLTKLCEYLPKIENFDVILSNLKDRKNVTNMENEVDAGVSMMESYIEALRIEIKTRVHLLSVLEQADAYYQHERGEVKVVTNAYKNFAVRVKNLKSKLEEIIPNLGSPIPSPDINAPSPSSDSDFELPEYSYSDLLNIKNQENSSANSSGIQPSNMTIKNNVLENEKKVPPPPATATTTKTESRKPPIGLQLSKNGTVPIAVVPYFHKETQSNETIPLNFGQISLPLTNTIKNSSFVFDQSVINQLAASVLNFSSYQTQPQLQIPLAGLEKPSKDHNNSSSSLKSPTCNSQLRIDESTKSMFENLTSQSALKTSNGTTAPLCTNSSSDEKTAHVSDGGSTSGTSRARRLSKTAETRTNHRSREGSDDDDDRVRHANRNQRRSGSSDRSRTPPRSNHAHNKNGGRDYRRDVMSSRHSYRN